MKEDGELRLLLILKISTIEIKLKISDIFGSQISCKNSFEKIHSGSKSSLWKAHKQNSKTVPNTKRVV